MDDVDNKDLLPPAVTLDRTEATSCFAVNLLTSVSIIKSLLT